jgi:membrane protein
MPATNIRTALFEQKRVRQQRTWWNILKLTASEWVQDDAMTWAAAVSCYTLLALAPMLVIAIQVGTFMSGGREQAVQRIQSQVQSWMGSDAARAIRPIIDRIIHRGNGYVATSLSILLIVFGIGGLFSELQQAMNRIWKVKPRPGRVVVTFVRARIMSVIVMTIAAIVLITSVFVTAFLENAGASLGIQWRHLATVINALVSVVVLTLLFALLYRTIPDAEIEWGSTFVGAIISAILFVIGKYGLAYYFKLAAPSSAYGAAGSLAAVLIWVYYSAQIVFFGAEFTQVYAKTRGHGVRPSRHAQFLSTFDETETATPSNESPDRKPPRGSFRNSDDSLADYSQVLTRGLRGSEGRSGGSHEIADHALFRNMAAAALGLAIGAIIGGRRNNRSAGERQTLAAASIGDRMKRVEKKLDRVSRGVRAARRYL